MLFYKLNYILRVKLEMIRNDGIRFSNKLWLIEKSVSGCLFYMFYIFLFIIFFFEVKSILLFI